MRKPPLYIDRLTLTNIRCFEHLTIPFNMPGESLVIIGDNGEGKSTLLRSLAMGICDQSSAAALFRELHGDFVRTRSRKDYGKIEVELRDPKRDGAERYCIETTIKSLRAFERVEQTLWRWIGQHEEATKTEISPEDFPWDRIFASGYGPGIRVQGMSDYDYYLAVDAVYPLFRYDVLLQSPELVVRRLLAAARQRGGDEQEERILDEVKNLLAKVLRLKPTQIDFSPHGISIQGPSGKVGLSAAADGYRGTVTWILDLIAWWFVYRRRTRTTQFFDLHGIVFVDEIEQHLHPNWQRTIMRLLTESFQKVQFIVTTHSPLVASGCEGIPVLKLKQGQEPSIEHPFGWLAEDVYHMMGLGTSRAGEMKRRLAKFEELDLKRLRKEATDSDLDELKKLRHLFDQMPQGDPLMVITELKSLRKSLESSDQPNTPKRHEKR